MSANYFEQKLQLAYGQIKDVAAKKIAQGILDDFPGQRARLELRIEQLLKLLEDVSQTDGFII